MEKEGGDHPQTLSTDLAALHDAGFGDVTVFWRDTRKVVIGGRKGRYVPFRVRPRWAAAHETP